LIYALDGGGLAAGRALSVYQSLKMKRMTARQALAVVRRHPPLPFIFVRSSKSRQQQQPNIIILDSRRNIHAGGIKSGCR
jgi:hypothetical protein